MTFANSALDQAWIQDATGGVRVDRIGLDPLVRVGDVVELTGRATMGGAAPVVLREKLRILSSGAVPPPVKITAADIAGGRHQYRFVEASGIIRHAAMDARGRLALTLRTDNQDLNVGVREVGRGDPAQYLDAAAPEKGTGLITAQHRAESGEALLRRAKDMLFALLFGDDSTGTRLERTQQELLTLAQSHGFVLYEAIAPGPDVDQCSSYNMTMS